ncbi:hypothetical protein ACHAW6_003912 [Cyclotella cf. meneghiniana]
MDWSPPSLFINSPMAQAQRPKKRSRVAVVGPPGCSTEDDEHSQILITSRDNDFVSKTWWMIDMEGADDSNVGSSQGATPLVKRCMRAYGWDFQKTRRVLKAYRQFLFLKKHYQDWDAEHLSPSLWVDQMWHQHILDVVNYCHDMMLLCGRVVGHNPDGALDAEGKKRRDLNTREALEEHYFDGYDREIWGIDGIDDAGSDGSANVGNNPEMDDGGDVIKSTDNGEGFAADAHARALSGAKAKDEMISINIRYQGVDTAYTVKKLSRLSHCFELFARSKGKPVAQFEFKYNNQRVDGRSSANSLYYNEEFYIFATLKATNHPAETVQRPTNTAENEPITIRVKDYSGDHAFFKVKKSTSMAKIFSAFASRKGVDRAHLRFFLEGLPVRDDETPVLLGLEDYDQIDAVLEQRGC